jgi:hypothetical protein
VNTVMNLRELAPRRHAENEQQGRSFTRGMNNRPVGGRNSETLSHLTDMIKIINLTKKNKSAALQALTNLGPVQQPPLAVFPDCTIRYWVDMWSAHRIPQLDFQLSKPDRYFFIQVTTQFIRSRG